MPVPLWLRDGGYHVLSWALMALLWSVSTAFAACGAAWPGWILAAYATTLLGAGLLLALVHGRRVTKMQPRAPAIDGAFRRWVAYALLAAFALAGLAAALGLRQYVEPTFLLVLGAVCWGTGRLGSAAAYRYLGGILVMTAVMAAGAQSAERGAPPSLAGVVIVDAVLAAVVLPTACIINRLYLWHRSG